MKAPGEIWRQRLWVWVPALVFFLANAGAFAVYRLGYAGRIESLQETLDDQQRQSQQSAAQQRSTQAMLDRVRTNERQVQELYAGRLSPRSRRLTGSISEVKELAQKSGLVPRAISYPEEDIEEFGLVKRSSVFSVEGTYVELRKFINLLEVSPSFLSLDGVSLVGNSQGPELRIDLSLSTLFAKESDDAGVPANVVPPAPGGTS